MIEGPIRRDLCSMAGGSFRIKSVLGRPGKHKRKEKGIEPLAPMLAPSIPLAFSARFYYVTRSSRFARAELHPASVVYETSLRLSVEIFKPMPLLSR